MRAETVSAIQAVRSWLDFALRNDWTPDSHALACRAQDKLDAAIATEQNGANEGAGLCGSHPPQGGEG